MGAQTPRRARATDARYYCSYLQDKFTTLYEL